MAFYSAYFDESTGNNSPILVVAGFLSTDAQWMLFEKEWREVLAEFQLSAFHMQHFATRKKEFQNMDEHTRKALLGKLLNIINQRAKLGFAAVVHTQLFEDVFKGRDRTEIGSPYRLCCTACFLEVGEWAKKNYQIEPVAYFFDAGNPHSNEVSLGFKESTDNPNNAELRLGSITFEDDKVLVPLQAADIAVYEIWKWLDEHFLDKARHGRYPLQEIFKIPFRIREFDRGILEEMLTHKMGGHVDKKIVHHMIRAIRPVK